VIDLVGAKLYLREKFHLHECSEESVANKGITRDDALVGR
jgi:hypothetical protein